MKNIATALVKAQKEFGPALKNAANAAFSRGPKLSKYADLESCLDAVQKPLNDNGIALMQMTHECSDGVIVETTFLHESGEMLSAGKLHVPAPKHDPHGYGSALTYARRYSLMAACGIAPEDDDGNKGSGIDPDEKKAEQKKLNPAITAPIDEKKANKLADLLAAMETAPDHEKLRAIYTEAYTLTGNDQVAQTKVIDTKNKRKAELTNAN